MKKKVCKDVCVCVFGGLRVAIELAIRLLVLSIIYYIAAQILTTLIIMQTFTVHLDIYHLYRI